MYAKSNTDSIQTTWPQKIPKIPSVSALIVLDSILLYVELTLCPTAFHLGGRSLVRE